MTSQKLLASILVLTALSACGETIEKDPQRRRVVIIDDGVQEDTRADDPEGETVRSADDPDVVLPEPPGEGVFLYHGADGGGPDHTPEDPEGLFQAAGIAVATGEVLPADFADDYGVLVLLNPRADIPSDVVDVAVELVERGGRVVSVVDHSDYGGHDEAAVLLEAVGSTMRSVADVRPEYLQLELADVAPLRDGVAAVSPFWSARVDVGDGTAFGQTADGYVSIGYEEVGAGDVVIIGDASMFGYALDRDDNAAFILNLAALR